MRPLTILLVEDHKDSLVAMSRLLRHEGYLVTAAGGLADAVSAAAGIGEIDVLVSDMTLGDGNGCDLLRILNGRVRGGPRVAGCQFGQVHDDSLRRRRETRTGGPVERG